MSPRPYAGGPQNQRGPRSPRSSRSRRARLAAGAIAIGTAGAFLGGCGIRSTSVPVDAGAAPSRVACVIPGGGDARTAPDGTAARVYLVCGSRVVPVHRLVRLPEKRPDFARALLDELQDPPGPEEVEAGFESAVPRDLKVTDAAKGDPGGALRLNTSLAELPRFALAQIVCSYADAGVADKDGGVTLGGPGDDTTQPLRRYECDTTMRSLPEAAETTGTAV